MYRDTDSQAPLFDVRSTMCESAQQRLDKTWAKQFSLLVYPVLLAVEGRFAHLYTTWGRPNWSVARVLGVSLLQEMFDFTDQQAVDALTFDARWRYALGFGAEEDSYLSRQGLVEFRSRVVEKDPEGELLKEVFAVLTEEALTSLGLSTTRQRIDSSFIQSNIRERGRVDLLLTTLRHALRAVERVDATSMDRLSPPLRDWYEQKDRGRGWFGDKGPRLAIEQAGEWLCEVVKLFAEDKVFGQLEEVQLARRAFLENFDFEPDPDPKRAEPPEIIPKKHSEKVEHATTLQSPHDPDAGNGHKGRGYSLQVVETCNNEGAAELITGFNLTPANQPDQNQAQALIDDLASRDQQPEVLYADAGYITPTALEAAQSSGTVLHGPMYKRESQKGALTRLDFEYSDEGRVIRCPQGYEPEDHRERRYEKTKERHLHAFFNRDVCLECPLRSKCPVQTRNQSAVLGLVSRLMARDVRWHEQTKDEWWFEYSIRSGIEATMSELKRGHGCRKLRVRTKRRVLAALTLKLTACNMKRWCRAAA